MTDNWTPSQRTEFQSRRKAKHVGDKRSCGSCSMCCKVMQIPGFAGKPDDHDWCQHAKAGCGGCAIYSSRPDPCRDFHCMWLTDGRIPDYWFPAKSKIVISPHLAEDRAYVAFIVDPAYPQRWREEPWFSDLKTMARAGLQGLAGQKWTTVVLVGSERIPVLA